MSQKIIDNSTFDILNGTVFNATENSIQLNCTIKLQNTGMFEAMLHESSVDFSHNGIVFGNAILPPLHVLPNQPTVVSVSNTLKVTNKTHFKLTASKALENQDQVWTITNNNGKKQNIKTKLGSFWLNIKVKFEKQLVLPGAELLSFVADNFNVTKATSNRLFTTSDASFYSTTIFDVILPKSSILNIYINNIHVGYSPMIVQKLTPGANKMDKIPMIIEKTAQNIKVIEHFFSQFAEGTVQYVQLKGPMLYNTSTVIDNIVSINVSAQGSPLGNRLVFGGIVDKVTQDGWTVKSTNEQIRGAYANIQNPLSVPIRITDMVSIAKFLQPIRYDVEFLFKTHHCYPNKTDVYGQIRIGAGIVKSNETITWVDIPANGKKTFMTIASPLPGSNDDTDKCSLGILGKLPFSCCWGALTAASICSNNPQLHNDLKAPLTTSYIPLYLADSNITMMIDHQFEITLRYAQSFFPLFFGDQVCICALVIYCVVILKLHGLRLFHCT